jgi:hypothetical protein
MRENTAMLTKAHAALPNGETRAGFMVEGCGDDLEMEYVDQDRLHELLEKHQAQIMALLDAPNILTIAWYDDDGVAEVIAIPAGDPDAAAADPDGTKPFPKVYLPFE